MSKTSRNLKDTNATFIEKPDSRNQIRDTRYQKSEIRNQKSEKIL